MDRIEDRTREEALDREAWLEAWRRTRKARAHNRPAPPVPGAITALACLDERARAAVRDQLASDIGRVIASHAARRRFLDQARDAA